VSVTGSRATFDEVAELYDRVRPGYPDQLFEHLAALGAIGPGHRVLEIGCGTGQATVPLAERGCQVVAVELGARLAEVARRKLARFPEVTVVTAAFEEWPLPAEPFDLVLSATAFHWIDPAVRVLKSAEALGPRGLLATVATHHVLGGTVGFFADAQRCYERWDPATLPGLRLEPAGAIPTDDAELVASGRFGPACFRRYEWDAGYTAEGYRDLLLTYSNHRELPPAARDGLLADLTGLITDRYGGRVVKRYLTELRAAQVMARA
jgi:SAM-dependent methyltransferase